MGFANNLTIYLLYNTIYLKKLFNIQFYLEFFLTYQTSSFYILNFLL